MSIRCPQCQAPLSRVRRPTSWRQMMWGGWTCAACGAEIDRYNQVISGRQDSADGIVVPLRPGGHRFAEGAYMVLAFGSALGVIATMITALLLDLYWPLQLLLPAMLISGVVWFVLDRRLSSIDRVTLTAAAIRWPQGSLQPDAITGVTLQGSTVCITADGVTHRLTPMGKPQVLLEAIDEVRALGRDTGTRDDVPDTLRSLQHSREVVKT